LGLAIILFEGGLNLNLKALRENRWVVARLVMLGPLLTMLIGGAAAHWIVGMDWLLALLFGALVSVGGPTVILPIVRQMRLGRHISHVLTAEAMLIDVIGAILAIVLLQVALNLNLDATIAVQDILYKIVVGSVLGLIGGRALAFVLTTAWAKEFEIRSVLTLTSAWGMFLLADTISDQAGLLTMLMMGAILQRMEIHDIQRLKHFKGSLSMLLISLLFVLLAASIDISIMRAYLWQGLLLCAILAIVVRPLIVLLSTAGSHLSRPERLYLAGMAPRGVVAAGITSLFVLILQEHGFAQSGMLMAMVYIVIIVSVLGYSLAAAPLKRHLSIQGGDDRSVLIIGGGQFGAEVGRALGEDREIRFLDLNSEVISSLKHSGYDAVCGNALDPLYWEIIHAEEIGCAIVMTGSSDHNLLIARLAHENFHIPEIFVSLQEKDEVKHASMIHQLQAKRLFGKPFNFTYWNDQAYRKRLIYESLLVEPDSELIDQRMADVRIQHGIQLITIIRQGQTLVPHDDLELHAGDEIKMLMRPERIQAGQAMVLPAAIANAMP